MLRIPVKIKSSTLRGPLRHDSKARNCSRQFSAFPPSLAVDAAVRE
jgi:hypothetical protein